MILAELLLGSVVSTDDHSISGRRQNGLQKAAGARHIHSHTSKLSSPLNRTLPTSGVSLIAPGAACGMLKKG